MTAISTSFYRVSDYVRRARDPRYSEMIHQEHLNVISIPIVDTCINSVLPHNMNKNRYPDYPCWDISRVVLRSNNGLDFINANYVAGFDMSAKFIATQEPMPSTFGDFWTMVWQENSRVIVMLNGTKQQPKLLNLKYFSPNEDHTIIKEFIIKEERIKLMPHYVKTTLKVIYIQTGELRVIHHFQYLDWPETGIPDVKTFLDFMIAVNKKDQQYFRKVLQTNQVLPGPIVVHGDKGIGRTAAYCVADICLYQLVHTAVVSVPSTVIKVRQQRRFSIETPNHYIFINNVLVHFLVTLRSNVTMFTELRSHLMKSDVDMMFKL
ncbi:tyrosine-protein phosphatase non-receptor type 9-like [Bacillus rossius redtenbacheri]|uniref:tyrosine-protein phosphatase non-receptor type 9-like n=1 Tax=Bacillus rossius redtenbacheri TaxID=93214 RepID=UPI002FDC7EC1